MIDVSYNYLGKKEIRERDYFVRLLVGRQKQYLAEEDKEKQTEKRKVIVFKVQERI